MHTIVLATPFPIHRIGIETIIRPYFSEVKLIEIQDGEDLIRLLAHREVDLIIVDPMLPDLLIKRLFEMREPLKSRPPILVYSEDDELLVGGKFIHMGATGFIEQKCSREQLISAISTVLNGDIYLSEKVWANIE